MKKIISATALALTVIAGAARTPDSLRIYINPGHGSWTSNDRPCTLVGHGEYSMTGTDTLSFYEASTNLQKALGMLDGLIEYGFAFDPTLNQHSLPFAAGAARDMDNNIVLSRVKNGPFGPANGMKDQLGPDFPIDGYAANRSLTEIAAEVEANNFDIFVSVHSNALKEGTDMNYPLYLYRGYNEPKDGDGQLDARLQTEARRMAEACWHRGWENPHMVWTQFSDSNMYICGDLDFYGKSMLSAGYRGYLGVLRHSVPGILIEGYFHTYQPARHRAMNNDVCRFEGAAYARGIADYLGLPADTTASIYGIVRDGSVRFTDPAYTPNPSSDDVYLPLNGATVTLSRDGQTVATYTTDNYYNGAYVFTRLAPGDYTITVTHPSYSTPSVTNLSLSPARNAYPRHRLTRD